MSAAAKGRLDVEEVRSELMIALGLGADHRGPNDPPAVEAPELAKLRKQLLGVVAKLDKRLRESIKKTEGSMTLRYLFLTLLCLAAVSAIALAISRGDIVVGTVGSVVPTGLTAFLLAQLRGLQDERLDYAMRLARYEPRILAAEDMRELRGIGKELFHDLEALASRKTGGSGDGRR